MELLTHYVYVMARIALMDKAMFAQLMAAATGPLATPEPALWEAVLDEWWRRVCPLPPCAYAI